MANKYSKEELLKAFKCTKNNREQIMSGEWCGCISCTNIFPTYEIFHWFRNESGETASCPYCYEESVIGEKSGHSITTEFLVAMNEYWYKGILGPCWNWRIL